MVGQCFAGRTAKAATRQCAETPALFQEIRQPDCNYLLVPRVSSERRAYVPIGYMDKQAIASDAVLIIPSASLYHFGVLTSWVHMAWMRAVCGRLETRYRYSKDVVYNNFPWPEADASAVAAISETAQAILDARAAYPDSSLADLPAPRPSQQRPRRAPRLRLPYQRHLHRKRLRGPFVPVVRRLGEIIGTGVLQNAPTPFNENISVKLFAFTEIFFTIRQVFFTICLKKFITNFVIHVTNFLTHVTNFVTRVTKFVTKNIL